jgi:Domain of unknown function (DUF1929)/F5/8 type C domain/Glyoxal oxidase N-terminus/Kelch motif
MVCLRRLVPTGFVLAILLCSFAAFAQDPSVVGQWSAPATWPVVAIHNHLLPNGKVLAWQRSDITLTTDAYLWDPATGMFTQVSNPNTNMFCSGHSFLPDGRLLVSGGHHDVDGDGEPHANIFDPATNNWTRMADMNAGRWYPTSTALPSGEVLSVSGLFWDGPVNSDGTHDHQVNSIPQIWQTGGGWRTLTNAQNVLQLYPWMLLAPDGRIFNSGPDQFTRFLNITGSGVWSLGPTSNFGLRDQGSSVMYDSGKVMILGGGTPTNTVEVIDLNVPRPSWRYVGSMAFLRRHVNATILPDGKVLATGGTSSPGFLDATGAVFAAEMWDPATETWSTMASMQVKRLYHSTALLLPDGRVLSAGGGMPPDTAHSDTDHSDAEIYSPPYLFKGARPAITSAPATINYGQNFVVQTPDAAGITKVTLIRLPSVTHSFNQNQRINKLSFSQVSGGLNVTAPANANLCPPGHYMLFILNGNGVPSVASIVNVAAPAATVTNLAQGKAASQSSTAVFGGVAASANRAVDGNTDGNFADSSVSHTNFDNQAWWQVDLGGLGFIQNIQIYNRTDCCAERLSNFYVLVSDLPFTSTDLATTLAQSGVSSYFQSAQAGSPLTLPVSRTGRYVRVQLTGTNYLHMAEVQVLGTAISPINLALNQPATQSSTATFGSIVATADRAVDGTTDGNFADGSVSHTNFDNQAWWQVDLGAPQSIQTIQIYNRTDCCPERLSNFYVLVSDTPFNSTDLNTTLSQPGVSSYFQSGQAGSPSTITINRTGRYVRIQLSGANVLHMAEVQIWGTPYTWTNIAVNKPATQSSTAVINGITASANLAVDGNTDGTFANGSVTHTNFDATAWWQVDLGAVQSIQNVVIYNRGDCCPERLSNFYVFVSDTPFFSSSLSITLGQPDVGTYFQTGPAGRPIIVPVNRTGRYVRVQLSGTNFLHMSEVQIWH